MNGTNHFKDAVNGRLYSKQTRKKKIPSRWVVSFLIAASLAIVCQGVLIAILGPTLQYLVSNTRSTVGQASMIFSGHSFGVCSGAVAYSFLKGIGMDINPLSSTGIGLLTASLSVSVTPFIHSLALLVFLRVLLGFAVGYYATGLVAVYLTKWGEVGSRQIVQLHTLMFSVGTFIAPIIVERFLKMKSHQNGAVAKCLKLNSTMQDYERNSSDVSSQQFSDLADPVSWSFLLVGAFVFLTSMLYFSLVPCKVLDRITTKFNEKEIEPIQEKPFKEVWSFLLPLITFNFCIMASQILFGGYIFSIAVCSDLGMNTSKASLLNSVYWAGFMVGRASAVVTSRFLKPSTMVIADLTGITSSMIVMSCWGEMSEPLAWACTFVYGLSTATLFPSGISWSSSVISTSGRYAFVFFGGGNMGVALMQPIGGIIFQINPFAVTYLMTGLCVLNIVCFALMNLYARRMKARQKSAHEDQELNIKNFT